MAEQHDFLVEIGTEELPPKALRNLSEAFAHGLVGAFAEAGLAHGAVSPYATPRRLAVLVEGLASKQADREVKRRGPPRKVAYDKNGNPTKAATAFAEKCGIAVADIEKDGPGKDARLIWRGIEKGRTAASILPAMVQDSLDQLPVPRRMRWGDGEAEFVRPVHWVLMKLGGDTLEATICGVRTGNTSRGHRFMAPARLKIGKAAQYAALLEKKGKVLVDFSSRMEVIRKQVLEQAAAIGGQPQINEALLEEVTALVEWPVALTASFPEEFLELPAEVLTATLTGHQRYFLVVDHSNRERILPAFIAVANLDSKDPAKIREGNRRVVQPRLDDSMFFWNQDRMIRLEDRESSLKNVLFHAQLGSVYDKSIRTGVLAARIAGQLDGDPETARRAAMLAKCDLLTLMVAEFPELQGVMGRYYAKNDGLADDLAVALAEQYLPRFAGDQLPATIIGQALAIAEKIDTICGIFAIGQKPSGNKDPFALRRNALGCLRILIEREVDLDLRAVIAGSLAQQPVNTGDELADEIYDFMMDRLRVYYLADKKMNIGHDVFDAVLARSPVSPLDFHQRLIAVKAFQTMSSADSLAAANKRIANILRRSKDKLPADPDAGLLSEPAEQLLYDQLQDMLVKIRPMLEQRRYQESLENLAGLGPAVDDFFDNVMVMVEDAALRVNRLALLNQLRGLFLQTADLSRLQP
ncbi:MAG: glycine--tRNA ligase subunit beta [Proteobacteria bacterium]|nr:glycine--tRNA ligase subunit beta [Pseudomonadota bacterium]